MDYKNKTPDSVELSGASVYSSSKSFNSNTVIDQFRTAVLGDLGFAPDEIIADGQGHRFSTNGKHDNKDGRYILHLDGFKPAGYYECHRQGIKRFWKVSGLPLEPLTPEQWRYLYMKAQRERQAEAERLDKQYQRIAERARSIWRKAEPASHVHPYLLRKRVPAYIARVSNQSLLIPLYDLTGKMWSLQFIGADSSKRFLSGGKKHGLFCPLTCEVYDFAKRGKVLIAEGFATAATIATLEPDRAVIVAFDAGNLEPVVDSLIKRYPNLPIEIIADNDRKTERTLKVNVGLAKAKAVADKHPQVIIKYPTFPDDAPIELSDVNDLVNWQQQQETLKGVSHGH